jgi:hypothetical protein
VNYFFEFLIRYCWDFFADHPIHSHLSIQIFSFRFHHIYWKEFFEREVLFLEISFISNRIHSQKIHCSSVDLERQRNCLCVCLPSIFISLYILNILF